MKEKIISSLLNYWVKCSNNSFSNDMRLNLPGFKVLDDLIEINEIDDNKTFEIIEIISEAKHQKTSSKSVEKWNKGDATTGCYTIYMVL